MRWDGHTFGNRDCPGAGPGVAGRLSEYLPLMVSDQPTRSYPTKIMPLISDTSTVSRTFLTGSDRTSRQSLTPSRWIDGLVLMRKLAVSVLSCATTRSPSIG